MMGFPVQPEVSGTTGSKRFNRGSENNRKVIRKKTELLGKNGQNGPRNSDQNSTEILEQPQTLSVNSYLTQKRFFKRSSSKIEICRITQKILFFRVQKNTITRRKGG